MEKIKPIAIHLPQFHPIKENDAWWGKGFTEWTNVTKATPRFEGHYQPHLPADLGFYDLRLHETRVAQAELAKEYGIEGFCYYHYWFNGELVLEKPLEGLLKNPEPDFPFCLCWANENWTRNWDGNFTDVLKEQNYSFEDDVNHIRYLFQFFKDPRYLRVDGKPVFIVYRPKLFPDIIKTLEIWRDEARKEGLGELYLMYFENFGFSGTDPQELGFDACIEFQPNFGALTDRLQDQIKEKVAFKDKLMNKIFKKELPPKPASPFETEHIFSYDTYVGQMLKLDYPTYKRYPGIFPMWDNSARRAKGAYILHNSTPETFGKWLKNIKDTFKPFSKNENLLFINAWNEWAEGNHLEPCQKWGRAYLEQVKAVFSK